MTDPTAGNEGPEPRRRSDRRAEWLIAIAILCITGPLIQVWTAQPASRYTLSVAVVDDHSLRIDPYVGVLGVDRAVFEGHTYSDKAPYQPLLAVPAYAVFRAAGGAPFPIVDQEQVINRSTHVGLWWVTLWSATIPAILLTLAVRRLVGQVNPRLATTVALAVTLGTTMLPFTKEDFDPQLEDALELFPSILGDEKVGVQLAINGLLSLTPDGNPILGETPEVMGLWSAAAIWIKEGPGIAKTIAEWMTDGTPEIDPHGSDIARFYDHHKTAAHIRARASEGFNKTYGIVHPMEQWASNRNVRLSPAYPRQVELQAEFFEAAGWERPFWYGANERLLGDYGDRVMPREGEWESRWWSPIINAEHLAMRERVAMVDLVAFAVFDVEGPGACAYLEGLVVSPVDVQVGRVIYTPLLNERGGIVADLTIIRLAHDRYRVVTGGGMGMRDRKWFTDHLPADGSAQLHDRTSALYTVGVWGPRARDLVQSVAEADLSNAAFPFGTARTVDIGSVRTLMSRISYVGELGWEIYCPMEQGLRLWDTLWQAGQPQGVVPVGIGVYATTGRLEKGYRAHGNELELDFTLVEAGMARPKVKDADFIGKAAYLEQRANPPAAVLCTLTLDDATSAPGVKRYMLGREPITLRDGTPLVDGKGRRSYVTSAGSGPSVGKHLLMSYLPPEQAKEGAKLAVEFLGERYPVTVAVAGATPLFDPENARIRS